MAMPKAEWFEYEAVSDDNVREGTRLAFGRPLRTVLDLEKAAVIVSLDDDFLGGGSPLAFAMRSSLPPVAACTMRPRRR